MHANKERLFARTDSLSAIAQSIAAFFGGDCPVTLLALPTAMLEPERKAGPNLNAQSPPLSSGQ